MSVQRPEELHPRVMARLDELLVLVRERMPDFRTPAVGYYEGRLAAGLAYLREHRIELHRTLLRENVDDMLRETVAHELAHLVVWQLRMANRIPGNGRGHGRHWQGVMRLWLKTEPSRTHNYDCSNSGAKRQRRWAYVCANGHGLKLTTAKHKKAQSIATARKAVGVAGCGYLCRQCKTSITFTGRQAITA